jgi:voltage-gated potassium channel
MAQNIEVGNLTMRLGRFRRLALDVLVAVAPYNVQNSTAQRLKYAPVVNRVIKQMADGPGIDLGRIVLATDYCGAPQRRMGGLRKSAAPSTRRPMIQQLLFALALTSVTVVVHALGTVYLVIPATGLWRRKAVTPYMARPVWTLTRLVSLLLCLHLVEMAIWAAAFATANVLPNFETSLYFSLKSYTTVGYGDVLLPTSWRLLGPIEAAVGVLMLGWSTSIIVAAVQSIYNSSPIGSKKEP